MHWLVKALIVILGNALALWLANLWVPGFVLTTNIIQIIEIGLILAILNFLLKPLLALVLGPIILITLGLGIIIVNAIILWILPYLANYLDFLRGSISIQSIPALFLATIIVSLVNFVIHLIA